MKGIVAETRHTRRRHDHIKISNYCPKERESHRQSCEANRHNDLITSGLPVLLFVTCFDSFRGPTKRNLLLKAIKNQKNLVIYSSIDCFVLRFLLEISRMKKKNRSNFKQ